MADLVQGHKFVAFLIDNQDWFLVLLANFPQMEVRKSKRSIKQKEIQNVKHDSYLAPVSDMASPAGTSGNKDGAHIWVMCDVPVHVH